MQTQRPPDLSASRRYFSTAAQVYSSLDARSTVRASTDATCLQDLPADAPTRGRGAYITRGTSSVYTYRAVAGGRVGTMRRRARHRAREERTPNGCGPHDAPTRQHGKRQNPVRRGARLAETAIAREAAARRRRGGPGSLPLSLSLSPLSVDRRRGAPSSSSKRSARVQLCWHIS